MLRDTGLLHADERRPLLYLYAIAEDVGPDAFRDVAGIGGRPIRSLRHRGLSLLFSEVDRGRFDDQAIARSMVTTDWLESTVAAHDAVLRRVSSQGIAVIPLRLGTTSEDGDAETRLDGWFHAARHKLHMMTGASEWRVTVVVHLVLRPAPRPSLSSRPVMRSFAMLAFGVLAGTRPTPVTSVEKSPAWMRPCQTFPERVGACRPTTFDSPAPLMRWS